MTVQKMKDLKNETRKFNLLTMENFSLPQISKLCGEKKASVREVIRDHIAEVKESQHVNIQNLESKLIEDDLGKKPKFKLGEVIFIVGLLNPYLGSVLANLHENVAELIDIIEDRNGKIDDLKDEVKLRDKWVELYQEDQERHIERCNNCTISCFDESERANEYLKKLHNICLHYGIDVNDPQIR